MNHPYDTYLIAFRKFLADGMTYAEAFREFDEEKIRAAAWQEIRDDPASFHSEDSLWSMTVRAGWERMNESSKDQCYDLWSAGWTSEVPESARHNSKDFWRQLQLMSLYWRAPSKRPGKPGRRYLSTNQAWRAMQKDLGLNPNEPTPSQE